MENMHIDVKGCKGLGMEKSEEKVRGTSIHTQLLLRTRHHISFPSLLHTTVSAVLY